MSKFLNWIDIYGEEIKLRLKDSETVRTPIGGILTIITIILVIVFFWLLGNDVYYRSRPISYTEDYMLASAPLITLDKYTYPFSFFIADNNNNAINNSSMFTVTVSNAHMATLPNGTFMRNINKFNLVPCTTDHFPLVDKSILPCNVIF